MLDHGDHSANLMAVNSDSFYDAIICWPFIIR